MINLTWIYSQGIQPDKIYHMHGDKIQFFLWAMERLMQGVRLNDPEEIQRITEAVEHRVAEIVNNEIS
jgi:hypothetical protein